MAASQIRRGAQSGGVDYDIAEEEEYYVTRPHTSVRRYKQPVQRDTQEDYLDEQEDYTPQRRRSTSVVPAIKKSSPLQYDEPTPRPLHGKRRSPWLALCIGMLITVGLIIGFSAFASWWQLHQDDATFGRPRTYQLNAVVGHQDSAANPSHFIFLNLNGRVVIIELPGGDSTHALTYTGPALLGDGGDLIPVTGEFKDVNGDNKPDMIVHVQNQTLVFINEGTKFRTLKPGEQYTV